MYFNREYLYSSLEGRRMEVVTITSKDGMLDEKEELP